MTASGVLRLAAIGAGALALGATAACTFDAGGVPITGDSAPAVDAAIIEPADAAPGAPDAAFTTTPDAALPPQGLFACAKVVGAPPTLDANLSDWSGGTLDFDIGAAVQLLDASAGYQPSASVRARCRHDAGKIYFAFEVHDNDVVTDSAELYDDDSVGLYLDAKGDGLGPFGADDHELHFRPSDTANYAEYASGAAEVTVGGSVLKTSTGYIIEISLAKSSLGASGALPALLGFDLALTDDDSGSGGTGGKKYAYGLWFKSARPACADCCTSFGGQRAWCDTTMFGTLALMP